MLDLYSLYVPIPKRFVYVWSGRDFPYLNYLAVKSLRSVESEGEILIAILGADPESPYFELVRTIPGVKILNVDPRRVFDRLPGDLYRVGEVYEAMPSGALAARSNLIRYALLHLEGGIYLDFDTIVLRSFDEHRRYPAFIGNEDVWCGDVQRVRGGSRVYLSTITWHWAMSWFFRRLDSRFFAGRLRIARRLEASDRRWRRLQANNAVIGATRGSEFIAEVLRGAIDASPTIRYATGPQLVDRVATERPDLVEVLHRDTFYAVAPGESFRLFEDVTLRVPRRACVIHYASSNHREIVASASPGDFPGIRIGSVMSDLLESVECRAISEARHTRFVARVA